MAVTTPDGLVRILANIPWTNDGSNFRTFTSLSNQTTYFTGKTKYGPFSNLTFVRHEVGTPIALHLGGSGEPRTVEDLYDCNYLMYTNSSHGNKWFYAFITDVKYVNEGVAYVYFTEDIYQTWQFDFVFKPAYVVRQHTNNDALGKNTYPENFETGAYYSAEQTSYLTSSSGTFSTNSFHIIVFAGDKIDIANASEHGITIHEPGLFSGSICTYWWYDLGLYNPSTSGDTIKFFFNQASTLAKAESIISMNLVPWRFINTTTASPFYYSMEVPIASGLGTVYNRKMYTSPYCKMELSLGGDSVELCYENFLSNTGDYTDQTSTLPKIIIKAVFAPQLNITAYPEDYLENRDEVSYTVGFNNFPSLPFIYSNYKNWAALNRGSLVSSIVGNSTSIAMRETGKAMNTYVNGSANSLYADSNSLIATSGLANQIITTLGKVTDITAIPDKAHGALQSIEAQIMDGQIGVRCKCKTIKPEYARKIDDYFTMFGYAMNEVQQLNITGRKSWNYIQTIGATVVGEIPEYAGKFMERALNSGSTFWHINDVGNYLINKDSNNRPTNPIV